jgi:hypothetical protein
LHIDADIAIDLVPNNRVIDLDEEEVVELESKV